MTDSELLRIFADVNKFLYRQSGDKSYLKIADQFEKTAAVYEAEEILKNGEENDRKN
jgi:hypothetical protein